MYTGMHGVAAICAALFGRVQVRPRPAHRPGAVRLHGVDARLCGPVLHAVAAARKCRCRPATICRKSTSTACLPRSDGYLVIAAQVDDAWKRLARLIGGDALAADTRFHTAAGRNANRLKTILAKVRAWVAAQPSVEACCASLDAIDVPCATVQRIDEVLADPQIVARGMIVEQDHPVLGKVRLPNLPFRFSDCDTSPTSVAPAHGPAQPRHRSQPWLFERRDRRARG